MHREGEVELSVNLLEDVEVRPGPKSRLCAITLITDFFVCHSRWNKTVRKQSAHGLASPGGDASFFVSFEIPFPLQTPKSGKNQGGLIWRRLDHKRQDNVPN
jgi:hypothetical protein